MTFHFQRSAKYILALKRKKLRHFWRVITSTIIIFLIYRIQTDKYTEWLDALDDISLAFDMVDHSIFLQRLETSFQINPFTVH